MAVNRIIQQRAMNLYFSIVFAAMRMVLCGTTGDGASTPYKEIKTLNLPVGSSHIERTDFDCQLHLQVGISGVAEVLCITDKGGVHQLSDMDNIQCGCSGKKFFIRFFNVTMQQKELYVTHKFEDAGLSTPVLAVSVNVLQSVEEKSVTTEQNHLYEALTGDGKNYGYNNSVVGLTLVVLLLISTLVTVMLYRIVNTDKKEKIKQFNQLKKMLLKSNIVERPRRRNNWIVDPWKVELSIRLRKKFKVKHQTVPTTRNQIKDEIDSLISYDTGGNEFLSVSTVPGSLNRDFDPRLCNDQEENSGLNAACAAGLSAEQQSLIKRNKQTNDNEWTPKYKSLQDMA